MNPFERILVEPVPKLALSIVETAEAIGVCERTVQTLLSNGEIPSVRVGQRRLIPVDALKEWLSKRIEAVRRTDDEPQ